MVRSPHTRDSADHIKINPFKIHCMHAKSWYYFIFIKRCSDVSAKEKAVLPIRVQKK